MNTAICISCRLAYETAPLSGECTRCFSKVLPLGFKNDNVCPTCGKLLHEGMTWFGHTETCADAAKSIDPQLEEAGKRASIMIDGILVHGGNVDENYGGPEDFRGDDHESHYAAPEAWKRLKGAIGYVDAQERAEMALRTQEGSGGRWGDWITTFSGAKFWPMDARPEEVAIIDIAHALSNLCRWGGHCEFYSVAEHSLLVSYAVPPEDALWGLMHDATEAYLIDMPGPLKRYLPDYKRWEENLAAVIARRYGLQPQMPASVKVADGRMLATEAYWLLPGLPQDAKVRTHVPYPDVRPHCMEPREAKRKFLERFRELGGVERTVKSVTENL
jgi:hypothetical protein